MPDHPDTSFFPADNPAATAHVALLQGIINRLAGNSATCKTWCLTLVGALLSLAAAAHAPTIARLMLLPSAIFGLLDAMYLGHENAYRALYTKIVAEMRSGSYDRSQVYTAAVPMTRSHFVDALRSWSVWPLYVGLIFLYLIAESTGQIANIAVLAR